MFLFHPPGFWLILMQKCIAVVWNPWKEKAAAMADFGNEEYPHMVCIEPGHVHKPVHLAAGQTYQTSQVLTVA